ncbi:hypothetical protein RJ55_07708 [Drechmeria coniospora]|nr:hypothetical protein RJ55_07708 [Drechmeria coniospora]
MLDLRGPRPFATPSNRRRNRHDPAAVDETPSRPSTNRPCPSTNRPCPSTNRPLARRRIVLSPVDESPLSVDESSSRPSMNCPLVRQRVALSSVDESPSRPSTNQPHIHRRIVLSSVGRRRRAWSGADGPLCLPRARADGPPLLAPGPSNVRQHTPPAGSFEFPEATPPTCRSSPRSRASAEPPPSLHRASTERPREGASVCVPRAGIEPRRTGVATRRGIGFYGLAFKPCLTVPTSLRYISGFLS